MPHTFVSGETLTAVNMELLPKGRMASASVTANQGSITTITDLTSLSISWTAISAHYYWIVGQVLARSSVTTDTLSLFITDGSSTQVAQAGVGSTSSATTDATLHASIFLTGLSGSVTYKLRASRSGTGTMQMTAGATFPAYIMAVDLGA